MFPEWLEPMAATLTDERFTSDDWMFERKFDGIRLLAFKNGQSVRLLSRNRLLQNASYPSVVEAVSQLPVQTTILDGEATGVWGKQGRVAYHVFDILWLDGRLVTSLPLRNGERFNEIPLRSPPQSGALKDALRGASLHEGWEGVYQARDAIRAPTGLRIG